MKGLISDLIKVFPSLLPNVTVTSETITPVISETELVSVRVPSFPNYIFCLYHMFMAGLNCLVHLLITGNYFSTTNNQLLGQRWGWGEGGGIRHSQ